MKLCYLRSNFSLPATSSISHKKDWKITGVLFLFSLLDYFSYVN